MKILHQPLTWAVSKFDGRGRELSAVVLRARGFIYLIFHSILLITL